MLKEESSLFQKGRLFDSYYYIDRKNGVQHFLKVVKKGKLSHYELEWIDYDNNDLESSGLIKKEEDIFFIQVENVIGRIAQKAVSYYLSDCISVVEKIVKKEFKYVFEVVDFYNNNCGKDEQRQHIQY